MFPIPQSTSFVAVFKAYLSSDHVTEATGKTIAITMSKAGGAFGNPNAGATNATEIANGWYKVTLDTTDTGTLGIIALRGAAATIDEVGDRFYVVKATNGGLTALPDVAAEGAGGLFTRGTGAGQINQPANGMIDANVVRNAGTAITAAAGVQEVKVASIAANAITATSIAADAITDAKVASDVTIASVTGAVGSVTGNVGGNVTGSVGSVVGAVGSVSGLTASDVGAIKAKTDNLPSDPADASDIAGAFSTVNSTLATIAGYVDTEVAAIKARTDLIPASPAATGDAMTLTVAYDAAKTAASQTSVDDLPTNAELTTALDGADDATLAAIAALPTTSTVMSADITKVNGVTVNGDGSATPWGP